MLSINSLYALYVLTLSPLYVLSLCSLLTLSVLSMSSLYTYIRPLFMLSINSLGPNYVLFLYLYTFSLYALY